MLKAATQTPRRIDLIRAAGISFLCFVICLTHVADVSAQRVSKSDSKSKKPLPYPVQAMPQEMEDLEIIHRRSQLVITKAPISRVAIADPTVIDIVQYSQNEVGIIGSAIGTTNMTLWFENSPEPLIYLVEVIRDPTFEDRLRTDFGKLEKQLQILFPASQVFLIPLQQRLIVKGQARDAEEAARILQIVRSAFFTEFGLYGNGYGGAGGYGGYGGGGYGGGFGNNNGNNNGNDDDDDDDFIVNMLEVPGNHQIMLHVKVAEISRGQLRRLGVDLNALLNDGRHVVGASLGGLPGTLTGIFENGEVNVMINWLAGNRTAKILAAPTLTVLSGHSASFLSGGEFPVPTIVGVGGAQGTTTSFRGFGTSLLVQPTVVDKDFIKLNITPEYSQLNGGNGAGGVPGLNSRRVSTTVRLREGQTIVLAGLFGNTMTTEVNRIPFLGELPVIGPAIFNSKQSDIGENELLITVTPELVRPMEPDEVPPLPGFYVTPPNDIELYSYAKTEGYPDQGVYQLSPYGWGPGHSTEIGYRPFNPASFGPPDPFGGSFGSYGGASAGFGPPTGGVMQPQPAAVYAGPPVSQAPPAAPGNYGQYAPPAQMAPIPDQGGGYVQPQGGFAPGAMQGGIQQVGYEESQQNGFFRGMFRGNQVNSQNPAVLPTNASAPSLENGNDPRLNAAGVGTRPRNNVQQARYQR